MIEFRAMQESDIAQVCAIENANYPFPWSKILFTDALHSSKRCISMLQAGELVGYGILSFVVGEAELLNISIAPSAQGQGLGRQLLQHLVLLSESSGNTTLFLEVRESNAPARHLYESEGFNEIGLRKGYYPVPGGRENAILMALPLSL
ncbi:MAG: ribosomal protein S18-alanine N-acetyltransferase [Oceanospirillaceae bacterium]|nr:ribosomal protein S18-alanine N-acetyltransferase [Oceanospirillaceae bacterium]MCP5351072.1 ribosomal protein S18-alanine N-acetyltransferase [Oceanospirillaceae bacterium]